MAAQTTVTIGTRESKLARWQSARVAELIEGAHPGLRCRVVTMSTAGDRELTKPIPEIGGKGLFTAELEEALRSGAIDVAVHSLKDLPTSMPHDVALAAVCQRADARDVLVSRSYESLEALPSGARVGTSSPRRIAQLALHWPDLTCVSLRGNVDTRVRKAMEGEMDAVVIAGAGVLRLGLDDAIRQWIPLEVMLPAPGQGALAIQARRDDGDVLRLVGAIDEPVSRSAATAERTMLEMLGGGCAVPVAAYAEMDSSPDGQALFLRGLVAATDGSRCSRADARGPANDAESLGREVARKLLDDGAGDLL
jgi:hydroxymethylbilane synthase